MSSTRSNVKAKPCTDLAVKKSTTHQKNNKTKTGIFQFHPFIKEMYVKTKSSGISSLVGYI
jgi:hypothetical protein